MPTLNPNSLISEKILPPTGSHSLVLATLSYGIYTSTAFISGAVDMVSYVYQRLGGNLLDIELEPSNVYNAYESAVLKYSELINNHHAKNILFSMLGLPTGTFDQDGTLLTGQSVTLLYAPPVSFGLSRQIGYQYADETGIGGIHTMYSASFPLTESVADYDLQAILQADPVYSGIVNNHKIVIREVFYKNPLMNWRYSLYYGSSFAGGLGGYGGGAYGGASKMQIMPTWEMKLRIMSLEDALDVRMSHYTYEIKNNKVRLFPSPGGWWWPERVWFKFWIPDSSIDALISGSINNSIYGINNYNTIPLTNIPFESINSPGKNFIREYAFWLCVQTLGWVRSKIDRIPIPNGDVKLNGAELLSEAREKLTSLLKDFNDFLGITANSEIAKRNEEILSLDEKLKSRIPMRIFKI